MEEIDLSKMKIEELEGLIFKNDGQINMKNLINELKIKRHAHYFKVTNEKYQAKKIVKRNKKNVSFHFSNKTLFQKQRNNNLDKKMGILSTHIIRFWETLNHMILSFFKFSEKVGTILLKATLIRCNSK